MVFMGSDAIALPALEAIVAGACGEIEIPMIYTQPDRPRGRGKAVTPNAIKAWALERGIELRQPERMGKEQRCEIAAAAVDSILVMAYGHILSNKLIDTPRLGTWNLHTSLLPKYRGASPIQCAVACGEKGTGVTLMKLVRQMDAGPVLDVERVRIGELDTALDVEERLAAACVPLLVRGLPAIHAGCPDLRAQDDALASYVRKLGKEDGELDFHAPAGVLARRINGLYPWPGARAWLGEAPVKIGLAQSLDQCTEARPGLILGVDAQGLKVACGGGILSLRRLQRPGGKMLAAEDFARGFPLPEGACFDSREMPLLARSRS